MNETLTKQIADFVQSVVSAMGVTLTVTLEESPEGTRINLEGEDGGVLIRRGGEGLQALQHVVATAFRRQLGDDNSSRRRLQRVSQGQGRRDQADGPLHGGEGAREWHFHKRWAH